MGKYSHLKNDLVKFGQPTEYQTKIDQAKVDLKLTELSRAKVGELFVTFKKEADDLEFKQKELGVKIMACTQNLVDRLEEDEETKFSTELGTFSLKDDPYSSIEDKFLFLKYIKESGQEDLLSVNYQTMSSLNKGLLESGKPPMPGTKVYMKSGITLRKSKEVSAQPV